MSEQTPTTQVADWLAALDTALRHGDAAAGDSTALPGNADRDRRRQELDDRISAAAGHHLALVAVGEGQGQGAGRVVRSELDLLADRLNPACLCPTTLQVNLRDQLTRFARPAHCMSVAAGSFAMECSWLFKQAFEPEVYRHFPRSE